MTVVSQEAPPTIDSVANQIAEVAEAGGPYASDIDTIKAAAWSLMEAYTVRSPRDLADPKAARIAYMVFMKTLYRLGITEQADIHFAAFQLVRAMPNDPVFPILFKACLEFSWEQARELLEPIAGDDTSDPKQQMLAQLYAKELTLIVEHLARIKRFDKNREFIKWAESLFKKIIIEKDLDRPVDDVVLDAVSAQCRRNTDFPHRKWARIVIPR
jgi:hypothetical protein